MEIFLLAALAIVWQAHECEAGRACIRDESPEFDLNGNPLFPEAGYELPQNADLFKLIYVNYTQTSCNMFEQPCGPNALASDQGGSAQLNAYEHSLLLSYIQCHKSQNTGDQLGILKHCPSKCKELTCARIENALPYSCTHIKNESLTLFNEHLTGALIHGPCFKRYSRSMQSLLFSDYKCQCMDGYKWKRDTHECIKNKEYNRCFDINGLCNAGTCQNTTRGVRCKDPRLGLLQYSY